MLRDIEIETLNTTTVDVPKPRTTQKIVNESLPFSVGRQVELNNVYGSPQLVLPQFLCKTIQRKNFYCRHIKR